MACSKECVLIAAIGGLLPTAAKLASTYTLAPGTPAPEAGLYVGLALFALIGAVLCYALSESSVRQALVLGIAAPGVITNIVNGTQDQRSALADPLSSVAAVFVATAHAQTSGSVIAPSGVTPATWVAIEPRLTRADAWSSSRVQVGVEFLSQDGHAVGPRSLLLAGQTTRLKAPTGATSVRLTAGSQAAIAPLPTNPNATLRMQIDVKGKSDFLWALGARRMPTVSAVRVTP